MRGVDFGTFFVCQSYYLVPVLERSTSLGSQYLPRNIIRADKRNVVILMAGADRAIASNGDSRYQFSLLRSSSGQMYLNLGAESLG